MNFDLSNLHNVGGILCHGTFDLLHIGHIRHLMEASQMFPSLPLYVTITADRFIQKGPGRPVFPQEVRAEWVRSLYCVDDVAIVEEPTALMAIHTIKPRIYVKGWDYAEKGVSKEEQEAVEMYGGVVHYTKDNSGISSTDILTGEYLKRRQIIV